MTSPTPNVTANDDAARAAGERESGMSDRTPSSVRTESLVGDADAQAETPAGDAKPASATQTIPGATTARAQGPATGSGAVRTKSASTSVQLRDRFEHPLQRLVGGRLHHVHDGGGHRNAVLLHHLLEVARVRGAEPEGGGQ